MIAVDTTLVFPEAHIQLPVQIVLNPPMTPDRTGELLGRQQCAQDVVARLQTGVTPGIGSLRERHPHSAEVLPMTIGIDCLRSRQDRIRPRLPAPVARL